MIFTAVKAGDQMPAVASGQELLELMFPGLPPHIYEESSVQANRSHVSLAVAPLRDLVEWVFTSCADSGCDECVVAWVMI